MTICLVVLVVASVVPLVVSLAPANAGAAVGAGAARAGTSPELVTPTADLLEGMLVEAALAQLASKKTQITVNISRYFVFIFLLLERS
jgi:hypothetical protein